MKIVQPLRDRKKIELFKQELMKKDYRNYMLFLIGTNTGLRISDILELKVKDVQGSHIIINEMKTGKIKRAYINSKLREEIDTYIDLKDDEDWLFPSRKKGYHIKRVQAYKILNEVASKIGVEEVGTHTLRKTFGYWHYKQYKDVAILQDIFNHSAPSITLRYIGINDDIKDKTIEDFFL